MFDRLARPSDRRERLRGTGRTDRAVVPIESVDHALASFLAMGADVEVLEPKELRDRLRESAETLALRYRLNTG